MPSTPILHHKASLKILSNGMFTPLREVANGAIVAMFARYVEVALVDDVDVVTGT